MKRGLLIGAGFSYDLGMPKAKELTKDFFYFLNEKRLRQFINVWKKSDPYGCDRPLDEEAIEEVYNLVIDYKNDLNCNYECFLKELQNRYNKFGVNQSYRDSYHFVFGKFFSIICHMFWMYHYNNWPIYQVNKQSYKSFSDFVGDNELWVLTLNHDLFIEFLCMENNIPISFGSNEEISFPLNNYEMGNTINFKAISREDLRINNLNFYENQRGVNIIKIHGALNEFTYNDDKNIIHIDISQDDTPASYLNKLGLVINKMKYYIDNNEVNIGGGELAVSDMQGEMQFFRRSILTGGCKYSKTFDPKPGEEKISLTEQVIKQLDELTVIGYSFCDKHINLRLYNAMLLNERLKITIVDPFYEKVPESLEPFDYNLRVRGARCSAPEWLWYSTKNNWNIENADILKIMRENRSKIDEEFRNNRLT